MRQHEYPKTEKEALGTRLIMTLSERVRRYKNFVKFSQVTHMTLRHHFNQLIWLNNRNLFTVGTVLLSCTTAQH